MLIALEMTKNLHVSVVIIHLNKQTKLKYLADRLIALEAYRAQIRRHPRCCLVLSALITPAFVCRKNNDINPILTGRFGASESDEAPLLYKFTK